ncbi:MAG: dTDP-4-dehydrorhamnose 3,5-epimerase [Vicinamibacteria bacterium]|nr:dTDP-4-dehydrorhamnose 3,5-epimerase [Vicinamibacteria bacterium]
MKVHATPLGGLLLIEPQVHRDARGYFLETHHQGRYAEAGVVGPFVQDNLSYSVKGTLRGLHAQLAPHAQGKLVRAVDGELFDVAVDVRRGSPTFGRWYGTVLSGANMHQLWVPPGFAHGFCVLSERVHVEYKCTDYYAPAHEIVIRWDDPEIGVGWPAGERLLSPRDAAAPRLSELLDRLPAY